VVAWNTNPGGVGRQSCKLTTSNTYKYDTGLELKRRRELKMPLTWLQKQQRNGNSNTNRQSDAKAANY
jgi:hypothetical protein